MQSRSWMNRAMAYHAHVRFGNTEKPSDVGAGVLIIKRHNDCGPLALFKPLQAFGELLPVQAGRGLVRRRKGLRSELFEQALFSLGVAAQIESRQAARSQHERHKSFGLAQASHAQRLESCDENLLHQVVGSMIVSQMAQAIKPNAGRHAAEQLGFGERIVPAADPPRQFRIVYLNFHQHVFYV